MLTMNIFWVMVMVTLGLWIAAIGWIVWLHHRISWSPGFVKKSKDPEGATRFIGIWVIILGLLTMATPFLLGLTDLFWYVYGLVSIGILIWLFVGGKRFY